MRVLVADLSLCLHRCKPRLKLIGNSGHANVCDRDMANLSASPILSLIRASTAV